MDPFLGMIAVILGFSNRKDKRKKITIKKDLDSIINEHFYETKKNK
jgi:hypothetical protein